MALVRLGGGGNAEGFHTPPASHSATAMPSARKKPTLADQLAESTSAPAAISTCATSIHSSAVWA